jgi:ELWxxDGT repeat protein
MKKIITFLLSLNTLIATAQNPLIVKSVGTTVLQPNTTTNSDFWKYNEWNGMRFYQGTGTPIKLCVTDGTTAGTKYITDIGSGSALGYSLTFVYPAQDFIYLLVYKIISGPPYISQTELWRSDGTASGTSLVYTFEQNADLSFGSTTTNTQNYSVVGNTIFFRASTAANGNELWKKIYVLEQLVAPLLGFVKLVMRFSFLLRKLTPTINFGKQMVQQQALCKYP